MKKSELAPDELWEQIANEPVLDTDAIDRLRSLNCSNPPGSKSILQELHEILRKDLATYDAKYRAACAEKSIHNARQMAHAIKGASQTAGFRRLEILAGHLEEEAIGGSLILGNRLGYRLESEISNALQDLMGEV